MKLLRCDSCEDVFALKLRLRTCACGKSSGQYIDPMTVEVSGPCRVFGIDNSFWAASKSYSLGQIFLIKEPDPAVIRK